ncbi:ATP-grasp domain-containing protein [Brevibacillus laterosporus]|uniref:Alanine-anticapsin ligase BacD n=1 Tax=Brevibacillus laterosporus LMG 15441 TaxID=1042163 RepID=A0A075RBC8_BRELA|nr:ATP-grasp domain-containing protein [Brevibacillus laterosporus]AIG26805.1 alanine-anticapsin ligase BacD [Brevibacillus laterosporus LMG 15441]RJL06050.1 ATP-grasp domain-containing protein [Brevibacillus laterosporus]
MKKFMVIEPIPFFIKELISLKQQYNYQIYIVSKELTPSPSDDINYINLDIFIETDFQKLVDYILSMETRLDALFTACEKHVVVTEKLKKCTGYYDNQFDDLNVLRDKSLMKDKWIQEGLPTSNYLYLTSPDIEELQYPCIIKPKSSYGSTGVKLINNPQEMKEQYLKIKMWEKASNHEQTLRGTIIEEYFNGDEFCVDTFWYKGEPVASFVMGKYGTNPPFFHDALYYIPPHINKDLNDKLIDIANKSVHTIGMRNGATHVEIKHNNGNFSLIEAAFRPSGHTTNYSLFKKQFNVDIFHLYLSILLGEENYISNYKKLLQQKNQKLTFYYDVGYENYGRVKGIQGLEKINSLKNISGVDILQITKENEYIGPKTFNSGNKLCLLIGYYDDLDQLLHYVDTNFGLNLKVDK